MESTKVLAILVVVLGLMVCLVSVSEAQPIGTAFTYQGWLMDDKKPADKEYDFQFRLYDANVGGTQQGSTVDVNDLEVTDGYFTVQLDFGNVFDGNERWLETTVAQSDGSDPCTLDPRLEVTLSPYAIYAKSAGAVPESIAGAIVPQGGIIMWSGPIANIPAGWALCDGTSGTPDLRDRFIVAAGNEYAVSSTGGEKQHTLTIAEMPSHYHRSMGEVGGGWLYGEESSSQRGSNGGMDHDNPFFKTSSTGGGQPHENRPPYYALAFIMKL